VILMAVVAALQLGPHAEITAGPSGEVTETAATFEFQASGPAPLTSFQCRLDSGAWAECTSPHELKDLGGGPHSFEVRLQGQVADPKAARREWTVKQQTEVVPPSLPEPVKPQVPPPPRNDRRRDARGCAYGANEVGEASGARIRRAVRCLVNVEREKRSLRPVAYSAALERAAGRHAHDMVRRRYFSHESPGGTRVGERVRATGYLRGARYWTVGEVLAWLVQPRPTPVAVVDAWMHSKPHKAVLLHPSFRQLGAAYARGNPRIRRDAGATFAAVFGRRT
jgi:uncharacterized protein YkwD